MPVIHSQYREAGTVTVDAATCTRCGACVKICPADVLVMTDDGVKVSPASRFGCIACGHCMMVCPEGAVAVRGRGVSPDDLCPLPSPEERATADALAALMQARRSVRRFRVEPVAPEVVARVVAMASTAPMGIPPWDVGCVSVIGRDEVRRVASEVAGGYEGFLKMFRPWVLAALRPFLGREKHDMFAHFVRPLAQTYVEGHRAGRDRILYDAPAMLVFHQSPYADALDASIACTYAMLAAESLGLGTTMIGGAPPILQRNRAACRRLGIPDANKPSLVLIMGWPAMGFRRTIRRRFAWGGVVGSGRDS